MCESLYDTFNSRESVVPLDMMTSETVVVSGDNVGSVISGEYASVTGEVCELNGFKIIASVRKGDEINRFSEF